MPAEQEHKGKYEERWEELDDQFSCMHRCTSDPKRLVDYLVGENIVETMQDHTQPSEKGEKEPVFYAGSSDWELSYVLLGIGSGCRNGAPCAKGAVF